MDPSDAQRAMRNPYEVLAVSPNASIEEIRDAYWRLIRFYRTEGDADSPWTTSHLEEIQEAYDLLSDPGRRAMLDAGDGAAAAQTYAPVAAPATVTPTD